MPFDISDFSFIPEERQKVLMGVCKIYAALIRSGTLLKKSQLDPLWLTCQTNPEKHFVANVELHMLEKRSLFDWAMCAGNWEACLDLIHHGFESMSRWNKSPHAHYAVWSDFIRGLEKRNRLSLSKNDHAKLRKIVQFLVKAFPGSTKAPLNILDMSNSEMVLTLVQELHQHRVTYQELSPQEVTHLIGKHLHLSLVKWGIAHQEIPFQDIPLLFLSSTAVDYDADANRLRDFWEVLIASRPEIESDLRSLIPTIHASSHGEKAQERLAHFQVWLIERDKKRLKDAIPESRTEGHARRL